MVVEDRSRARGTGVWVSALHESGWQQQARGCVNKAGVLVRLREVGWRERGYGDDARQRWC